MTADKAKQRLESIQKEGPIQPYDSRVLEELPGMINAQAQPYINKGLQLDSPVNLFSSCVVVII